MVSLKLFANLIVRPVLVHVDCSHSDHVVTILAVLRDSCYIDAVAVTAQELWHLVVDIFDLDPQTGKVCGCNGTRCKWLVKACEL